MDMENCPMIRRDVDEMKVRWQQQIEPRHSGCAMFKLNDASLALMS